MPAATRRMTGPASVHPGGPGERATPDPTSEIRALRPDGPPIAEIVERECDDPMLAWLDAQLASDLPLEDLAESLDVLDDLPPVSSR